MLIELQLLLKMILQLEFMLKTAQQLMLRIVEQLMLESLHLEFIHLVKMEKWKLQEVLLLMLRIRQSEFIKKVELLMLAV